jgi:hypothetical protein
MCQGSTISVILAAIRSPLKDLTGFLDSASLQSVIPAKCSKDLQIIRFF